MTALPARFARALASAAFAAAALLPASASADAVSMPSTPFPVEVVDGDTLRIAGTRKLVRLYGVDACEHDQKAWTDTGDPVDCAAAPIAALKLWTLHLPVTCSVRSIDRYGRFLAVCGSDKVPDFSAELIKRGLAVAYRFRSKPVSAEYAKLERQAKDAEKGLWALAFDEPWTFRAKSD